MKSVMIMLIGALLFAVAAPVARAADSKEAELQKRFEKRDKEIRAAKKAGVVGETSDGFVDWVKGEDSKYADVVNAENADRKELYGHIAEKTKTTAAKVADRAAKRNFELAGAGEYLKDKDGKWSKKGS